MADPKVDAIETCLNATQAVTDGKGSFVQQECIDAARAQLAALVDATRWRSMQEEPPKLEDLPIEAYNPDTKDTFPLWLVNEANFVSLGKKHFWRPLGALPKKEGV